MNKPRASIYYYNPNSRFKYCHIDIRNYFYCNNNNNQLRTFINGNLTDSISDYIINDNDRLLVIYGNETKEQLNEALDELNKIKIQFT